MQRAAYELGEGSHDSNVLCVEPTLFGVGDNPNCSFGLRAYMKRNDQSFHDGHFYLIEILKITAGILEKLWGVTIERDSAGTKVSRSSSANAFCELSGKVRPPKYLLS